MLRPALIGVGVALLCFLPPLLHFITIPLSPFIGGIVGGMQLKRPWGVSTGQVAGMAAIMASLLALIGMSIGSIVVAIGLRIGDGDTTISASLLGYLAVLVFVYTFGFAFLGGLLGALLRNRRSGKQGSLSR